MDLSFTATVNEIKQWAQQRNIKLPSGLRKARLYAWLQGYLSDRERGIPPGQFVPAPISNLQPVESNTNIPWRTHLLQHGWAVAPIPNWNSDYPNQFLSWLESQSHSFKRNDRWTWTPKNMPAASRGIFKHYFGHTEMQWQIRELTADIFADIWQVPSTDLLCSFDGGCFLPPTDKAVYNQWIHNDSPRDYRHCASIQGVVNFVGNGPRDGGLVLVENSHNNFGEYMDRHQSEGYVWGPADATDPIIANSRLLKICAPAGHIILFDCRMMHCNAPPTGQQYRMCTYVSMQPRSGATEKELQRRCQLYEEGRMTGHWCYGEYFTAVARHPRFKQEKETNFEIDIAPRNMLRSRLIGYS